MSIFKPQQDIPLLACYTFRSKHELVFIGQVVFVGMASLRTEWGVLQHEVCQALALEFVAAPQPTSAPVLRLVWTTSSNSMMRAMLALYDQDHKHLERVLDVCLEIGVLEAVLEATPFAFAIELASLAVSHSTGLNLEKWLQAQAAFHQLPFLAVSLRCARCCFNPSEN